MRVMCIEEKPMFGPVQADWILVALAEYEVLRVVKTNFGNYYELDAQPGVAYAHEHFAILPSRDADEMQDQERESIVNIETQPV